MGWSSFQDLWALGVKRLGQPAEDQTLHLRRSVHHLYVWREGQSLYGKGSFDFDMPEGFIFLEDAAQSFTTIPREGEVGDPYSIGDLAVGPAALRWVRIDDVAHARLGASPSEALVDWPTFEDHTEAFFEAMLDHIHRRYFRRGGRRDFAWENGDYSAYLEQMPRYAGGHWQVFLIESDFHHWLSDASDPHQAPRRFATREEALEAALQARR